MEILNQFGIWGGGWTGWIIPFLFGLSVVVFFHELGHFLVARWCRVRVEAFSIGFGPELIGFNDRRGTRWKLAAIPLGGYVKFLGDENAASVPDQAAIAAMPEDVRRHSFFHQPVAARAAIVAAGPLANFLIAIIIFAGVFMSYGKPSTAARVDVVQPGSAAAAAGFQPGDVVLSIDGRTISRFTEMQQIVRKAMAYIHKHYAEPFSRQDMARQLGLSERYLTRCFRKEMGITPVEYLNRCRLKEAKAMLGTGANVTETALAVGFSSVSYFTRLFEKELGISPGAYRHNHSGR